MGRKNEASVIATDGESGKGKKKGGSKKGTNAKGSKNAKNDEGNQGAVVVSELVEIATAPAEVIDKADEASEEGSGKGTKKEGIKKGSKLKKPKIASADRSDEETGAVSEAAEIPVAAAEVIDKPEETAKVKKGITKKKRKHEEGKLLEINSAVEMKETVLDEEPAKKLKKNSKKNKKKEVSLNGCNGNAREEDEECAAEDQSMGAAHPILASAEQEEKSAKESKKGSTKKLKKKKKKADSLTVCDGNVSQEDKECVIAGHDIGREEPVLPSAGKKDEPVEKSKKGAEKKKADSLNGFEGEDMQEDRECDMADQIMGNDEGVLTAAEQEEEITEQQHQAGRGTAARAFQRVKVDEVIYKDDRLKDNSYWAKGGATVGWGAKAQEVLGQVRGKGFRHEKTKKKRGSYKGGPIDLQSHSIKFENSEDED